MAEWIADDQMSPEEATLAKERVAAVFRAVKGLSGKQRTVFLLRFLEELELAEIVAVTGMKEGTVKSHLFRALQAIREGVRK
jgi:RNA polymerase sigma-70 factor (ECF subfamily)